MLKGQMEARALVTARPRTGSGDLPEAFERLFLREYGRVAAIAYRVLGDAAESEDVAQDVFAQFYRRQDPDASYSAAWLYTAATHAALNAVRSRKRRESRHAAAARELDRAVDPEAEAIAAEEREAARAALARLPERTATLLVLRHSGLSYAEIATTLGIAMDQIGTRLRRAQEAFKREVTHDEGS